MPQDQPRISPALDLVFAAGADADRIVALLDDYEPTAILEPDDGAAWVVHFRTPTDRDAALTAVGGRVDLGITRASARDVPDEDWARRSQRGLTAVTVGRFVVAPPWDLPAVAAPADLIVIEPSTGFGTGHHQTTRLCLRRLQTAVLEGRPALDVGTGSGVLAIAAARLGAREVLAIDCDADALDNARDNVERNGVGAIVTLRQADLGALSVPPAAVVTANLTAAVLIAHAAALRRLVTPGGTLIASGFGPSEVDEVAEGLGLSPVAVEREDEWVAVEFRTGGDG